ncbi:MAG: hypothetical protein ABI041_20585 [Bdellovibrionia bacterium]
MAIALMGVYDRDGTPLKKEDLALLDRGEGGARSANQARNAS